MSAPIVAAAVYDAFTARIAVAAGAIALWVPADGTAAQLGLEPGAASVDELVTNVRYVTAAVEVPVIADAREVADVARAARGFDAAGVVALVVDDGVVAPADVVARVIPASELTAAVAVVDSGWERSADAVRASLAMLAQGAGEVSFVGIPFAEVTALLGLDEIYALEQRYAT